MCRLPGARSAGGELVVRAVRGGWQGDLWHCCLAQALVWRHGMDALDDRDVVFPVRYAAAALCLLDCLAAVSERTDAQLVVCVMRETENDPEALPRLRAGLQNMAKL